MRKSRLPPPRSASNARPPADATRFEFPRFLWGPSTSAQQVEADHNSDWAAWEGAGGVKSGDAGTTPLPRRLRPGAEPGANAHHSPWAGAGSSPRRGTLGRGDRALPRGDPVATEIEPIVTHPSTTRFTLVRRRRLGRRRSKRFHPLRERVVDEYGISSLVDTLNTGLQVFKAG